MVNSPWRSALSRSLGDGGELYQSLRFPSESRLLNMPDTVTLADSRRTTFVSTGLGALELSGRSSAIARVDELIRRAAARQGGVLIMAPPGADVESIAGELHAR